MATRDQEARSLVDAVRAAEEQLAQSLPEMISARPAGVTVPPIPRSTAGPDGTIQVTSPVLGVQSSNMMNGGKPRRGY
jgi:hypothetical protein